MPRTRRWLHIVWSIYWDEPAQQISSASPSGNDLAVVASGAISRYAAHQQRSGLFKFISSRLLSEELRRRKKMLFQMPGGSVRSWVRKENAYLR